MIEIFDVARAKKTILSRNTNLSPVYPQTLLDGVAKIFGAETTPEEAVTEILARVRQEGDLALYQLTELIDGVTLSNLKIPKSDLEKAYSETDPALISALESSIERIRQFHQCQPIPDWEMTTEDGRMGQRFTPVDRVGVYVPGGSAPLPSSLLMTVIPAQVAGVSEIIVCTPPNPDSSILAAAYMCGIEEIIQLGGAQAIGAMAFGTESVSKVDVIVGPGNVFVNIAKQKVFGIVGLDGLAGPTETMIIADDSANPTWVAADLIAQAEHDVLASAILVTPSEHFASLVQEEVSCQVFNRTRKLQLENSLSKNSGIVIVNDLAEAIEISNAYAAEHLCLCVEDNVTLEKQVKHAGGIFVGEYSFEVLGDYVAGPSHVMPTGGTARFSAPLNVLSFMKLTSIIALNDQTGRTLSKQAAVIAEVEQLDGHANAAYARMGEDYAK